MQNHNHKTKNNLQSKSFNFSLAIINLTTSFPRKPQYWVITDQLIRSATSIGANIIEAKASSSKREFIKFFEIALKSSNETEYWLSLLQHSHLVGSTDIQSLILQCQELSKILAASILTMKGKRSSHAK